MSIAFHKNLKKKKQLDNLLSITKGISRAFQATISKRSDFRKQNVISVSLYM